MKITLSEIWNFSELISSEEQGWSYKLVAGSVVVADISQQVLLSLKGDAEYDTELLPSIFTFREILWQPDVFTESVKSLPGLRILKAHCEDIIATYEEGGLETQLLYSALLRGLAACSEEAIASLESESVSVKKALGEFRTAAFPIVKFFIFHPQNRIDYYKDAVNRLNYAVKIMLTQFHGKYTELSDPYWEVIYSQPDKEPKSPRKAVGEKEKS
ncbi:MAG: hypothetical protein RIC30_16770 [Marinoscillum sp.]|uniref:hypothetical protein n=2 Tax=Marinoscillum sp. TaxID=2024838 RepID=UPI0032F425CA